MQALFGWIRRHVTLSILIALIGIVISVLAWRWPVNSPAGPDPFPAAIAAVEQEQQRLDAWAQRLRTRASKLLQWNKSVDLDRVTDEDFEKGPVAAHDLVVELTGREARAFLTKAYDQKLNDILGPTVEEFDQSSSADLGLNVVVDDWKNRAELKAWEEDRAVYAKEFSDRISENEGLISQAMNEWDVISKEIDAYLDAAKEYREGEGRLEELTDLYTNIDVAAESRYSHDFGRAKIFLAIDEVQRICIAGKPKSD
ncbi:hypothetical protein [Aeoliella sp.]|uniref:hypothetical protein n=1 Tax=Aeoliella sp. TaxID=2795800 RepID=UPI003CCB7FC1